MTSGAPDPFIRVQKATSYHTFTYSLPVSHRMEARAQSWACFCNPTWHSQLVCCWGKAGVNRKQCWLQAQRGCRGTAQVFCAAVTRGCRSPCQRTLLNYTRTYILLSNQALLVVLITNSLYHRLVTQLQALSLWQQY